MSNRSILDILEGRSESERPVAGDVADRLRAGQQALIKKWTRLRDLEEWTEEQEFFFWLSYEKWDRLERQARETGQIEGCPIGPEGCHEDAPIRCGCCAGGEVVHTPDMPMDAPATQTSRFLVCDRKGPPKVVDVEVEKTPGQQALFNMGRVH